MSFKLKIINSFSILSFLVALITLSSFFLLKIPFLDNYISLDANKSLFLLGMTSISLILFLISAFLNKNIHIPENKITRAFFILIPLFLIISILFSQSIPNSFFGKYVFFQSGAIYLSLFTLFYIIAYKIKYYKKLTWIILFLSNLSITILSILAVVFSKFNWINLINKISYFIDGWDTTAIACSIVIFITLVYLENNSLTKFQKILSIFIVIIHTLLLICIIMPDIWYAVFFTVLFIFITSKNIKFFYKKTSFYILLISFVMSFLILFSNGGFTTNIVNKITNFTNNYLKINYSFVKPNIETSLSLAGKELFKGKLFGVGPNDFYKVWQIQKTDSVITSSYWNTDFVSSYSAFTTLLVTLGVANVLLFIIIYFAIGINLFKKLKKENKENDILDYQNKFYLYSAITIFIFSFFIFLFFANISISIILMVLAISIVSSNNIKWKNSKNYLIKFLLVLLFIAVFIGLLISINKVRTNYIFTKAIKNYQTDNNISNLETSFIKAVNLSKTDSSYRLLTQFYIFKSQLILNSSSTDIEIKGKEFSDSINNAINSANMSIKLDSNDYYNYIILGSIYDFLIPLNEENKNNNYNLAKEAYNKALILYPKNPSIYLTLAQLEYNSNQNKETTIENLNKSLQIKPNYSQALFIFSQLSLQNNDNDNAMEYALKAVQSDPRNINALLQYGFLLINKKDVKIEDLNQAYTAFITILNLDPNNVVAAYNLGVTYILAGEYDQAQNVINILKQVLPNDEKIIELEKYLSIIRNNNSNNKDIKNTESKDHK